MSSIERGFIPLPEAQTEKVRIKVTLPEFIEPEKIGVNLRGIERLCQLGGIKHLTIVGLEDMDMSSAVPQIVGFNNQGSAYMGKASTETKASPSESLSVPDLEWDSFKPNSQNWANAAIAINMQEVKKRILEERKWNDGIRSNQAWAHFIDKGVKDGISEEGTKNVVFKLSARSKFLGAWVASSAAIYASGVLPISGQFSAHIPEASSLALEYLACSATMNGLDRITRWKKPVLSDKSTRYSLFYGPEVDRAILLKILTKTGKLVKADKTP